MNGRQQTGYSALGLLLVDVCSGTEEDGEARRCNMALVEYELRKYM
jgi:hypothetical protein